MKAQRTVLLNYPPVSSVWHLPAGISLLTSVLRSRGHEVVQRYGHIIGLEHLLSQHGGAAVDEALRTIRDPKTNIQEQYSARQLIERVSRAVPTHDTFRVERNNVLYIAERQDGTLEGLLESLANRESSPWFSYLTQIELPLASDVQPEVYGISISDERQLFPGMVLASLVKEALPETLVVVGGNFWSRAVGAFAHPDFGKLFRHADAFVYREGFQPLEALVETLDPRQASGTAWFDGDQVRVNPPAPVATQFEALPAPSFDGGAKQWAPDFVPQMYTMSNCLMQCGFCAIAAGSDTFLAAPRMISPAKIADVMMQTGAARFEIADEMFPINRQLALGAELKAGGYAATWNCYLTVTNDLLDPHRAEQLYEAGCRGVQLGLESLSRDTLVREHKGWNHPENYARILENLANAGIQTHVFLIVGIPGEPIETGLRWLPFLEDNGQHILTIKQSRYRLTKHSPEEMRGAHSEYIHAEPDDRLLLLNRNFQYLDPSCSRKRVEAVRDVLEQACREHWAYALTSTLPWWANRGRYSLNELRNLAGQIPPEPQIDHLPRAIAKMKGVLKEATGREYALNAFSDLIAAARDL